MAELTACRIFISLVAAAMLSLLFGLVRNEALNLEALKSPKETCFLNFYLEINYSFHDEKLIFSV